MQLFGFFSINSIACPRFVCVFVFLFFFLKSIYMYGERMLWFSPQTKLLFSLPVLENVTVTVYFTFSSSFLRFLSF